MNIVEVCRDDRLLKPFLQTKDYGLTSWNRWFTVLSCLYGLPIAKERYEFIKQVTGRDAATMPKAGMAAACFITGRRSGKSRMAAVIAAYEATVAGHDKKLAKGEVGVIPVISPTKDQSGIVTGYLKAIFKLPAFKSLVVAMSRDEIELSNGITIKILAGSYRTVRGYTTVAAVLDELAYFQVEEDGRILTDEALVQAVEPGLVTLGGRLICITTPYARKGYVFKTWQRHFGNETSDYLVVNCGSKMLNPTLDQRVIDRALQEDLQAAKSEWLGEFRDDVSAFIAREAVERLVVTDRTFAVPMNGYKYKAFVDMSGGRNDDAALAIGHLEGKTVVLDFLKRYRPPFSPTAVIEQMGEECKRYTVKKVTGDHYAAEFVARAFEAGGIKYAACDKPKSQLYIELLPRIYSGQLELLDDKVLVDQISSLERRTRAGGRDAIDHPPNQHDDLANAVAGVAVECANVRQAGVIDLGTPFFAGAW